MHFVPRDARQERAVYSSFRHAGAVIPTTPRRRKGISDFDKPHFFVARVNAILIRNRAQVTQLTPYAVLSLVSASERRGSRPRAVALRSPARPAAHLPRRATSSTNSQLTPRDDGGLRVGEGGRVGGHGLGGAHLRMDEPGTVDEFRSPLPHKLFAVVPLISS